jgi:hypothetical protein
MPDHASKHCPGCNTAKPLDQFGGSRSRSDGLRRTCHECEAAYSRHRYKVNREKSREKSRRYYEANREAVLERGSRYVDSLRAAVFDHYGSACACCGSTERLSIDHVNGDGGRHRKELFGDGTGGWGFYLWLIRQDFPVVPPLQVLCHGCNTSKGDGDRCRLDHATSDMT